MNDFFEEYIFPRMMNESKAYKGYLDLLEYLADFENEPSLKEKNFCSAFFQIYKDPFYRNCSENFSNHLESISESIISVIDSLAQKKSLADMPNLKSIGACLFLGELQTLIERFFENEIGQIVEVHFDGVSYSYPALWINVANKTFDIDDPQSLIKTKRILKRLYA